MGRGGRRGWGEEEGGGGERRKEGMGRGGRRGWGEEEEEEGGGEMRSHNGGADFLLFCDHDIVHAAEMRTYLRKPLNVIR